MARSDDMERRLDNWARWMHGGGTGGIGFASVNLLSALGGDRSSYREATIPTVDCEGAQTDEAIKALPVELGQTLRVVYLLGCGMQDKARRLGVTEATVRLRIGRAHRLLESWLVDKAQQCRAQRERVEAVQKAARSTVVSTVDDQNKRKEFYGLSKTSIFRASLE